MALQPRDIPGFYYDIERNKYFRIQANHQVAASSSNSSSAGVSRYTKQAVDAARVHARELRWSQSADDRKQAENIHRSHLLTHPVHGLDLRVRLGDRKAVGDDVRRQYAWMLRPNTVMGRGKPGDKFAVEERSKALFTTAEVESRGRGAGMREMSVTPLSLTDGHTGGDEDAEDQSPKYDATKTTPILNSGDASTILPLSERLLIWSFRRPDDVNGIGSVLCISKKYANDNVPWDNWREEFGDWGTTALQTHTAIWDFAVPRTGDGGMDQPSCFVMATSSGVRTCDFEYGPNGVSDITNWERISENHHSGEHFIVTFKDGNVFMAGGRSRSVIFGDVRVKGAVTRLKHGSGVSGLRRMRNENLVLVNGLENMAVYDLRYPGWYTGGMKKKKKKLADALLEFDVPESMQQKRLDMGFDYDEELNLVASCSTDFGSKHKVGLWDCGTGRRIEEGALAAKDFDEPVTCLQMIDLRGQGQSAKSIMTKSGGIIEEWHV